MRTQAAVLYAAGTDWKVEDIELDPPRTGEVLVRVAAAGLCHSKSTTGRATCRSRRR